MENEKRKVFLNIGTIWVDRMSHIDFLTDFMGQ